MRFGVELMVALTIILGAPPLAAQDLENEPGRALRLLPVGQAPGRTETLLIYPPREVTIPAPPPGAVTCRERETGEERGVLRLNLFRFSKWVGVNGELDLTTGEPGEADRRLGIWHRLKIPDEESRYFLGILFPNPGWGAPKSLVVADDLQTFPAGALRVVNVSPYRLRVAWGGTTRNVPTNGMFVEVPPTGDAGQMQSLDVSVHKKPERNPMRVLAMDLEARAHERTTVVVYRATGLKTSSPVGFSIVRDRPLVPEMPIDPPKLDKRPVEPPGG